MHKKTMFSAAKATQIVEELSIREPSEIHIRDIAMIRGAFVRERVLEGSEARLIRKSGMGIITVNSRIREEGRKRFAIAHELGHFELHRATQLILCTEEDVLVWNENKSQENEANEFASEILMPEVIFLRYIKVEPPNMETVKDISKEFRTSITATTLRYVQLSAEPCAVVISIGGLIKWYKKSNSFDFHIKVGENLSPNTYAFDFYDGKDLPNKPRKVPASAWLAGRINEDAEILEHSLGLTTYDVVLSLLWINEEIRFNHQSHDNSEEPDFDLTNPFTPDGKRWRW